MKFETYVKLYRDAKPSSHYSSYYTEKDKVKILSANNNKKITFIFGSETCKCCSHKKVGESMIVEFNEPIQLTIFEAGLLCALFYHKKTLGDYGCFHNSLSGMKFIENIKQVII